LSVGLDCYSGRPQMMANRGMRPDCQDQTRFRRLGTAKTGYPLNETVTMYGPDGAAMFTMTKEVVDLSREPLDAALFDLPAGYTEAQSAQELYAQTSMAVPGMPMAQPSESSNESNSMSSDRKAPGTVRIGIVPLSNKTDHPVSTESLRDRLIGEIQGAGIEAVPLNAESQAAADAEARGKQCDFVLYTDISALKSSKVGGMFGRVTGVSGAAKTDSRIDFRLIAVGSGSPLLQSSATAKEDGDEQSAGIALDSEARMVIGAVRKR
jgi:ABC-type phosphate/phosphonate transport system substrate-binding protein